MGLDLAQGSIQCNLAQALSFSIILSSAEEEEKVQFSRGRLILEEERMTGVRCGGSGMQTMRAVTFPAVCDGLTAAASILLFSGWDFVVDRRPSESVD